MRIATKIVISSAFRILNKQMAVLQQRKGLEALLTHICLTLCGVAAFGGAAPQGCPSARTLPLPSHAVFRL